MLCWLRSDSVFTPHLNTACLTQLLLLVATEMFRIPLVDTRLNEEETSSDKSFSSFLKSRRLMNEYMMKCAWIVMIIFFHCHFLFLIIKITSPKRTDERSSNILNDFNPTLNSHHMLKAPTYFAIDIRTNSETMEEPVKHNLTEHHQVERKNIRQHHREKRSSN